MNLAHMSDKALLLDISSLVHRERNLLNQILWHLREIDRRKLYCEVKCGSLFQYCVKILKYSEGQASRRVTACRLLKEIPEISEDISDGLINLSQLNQANVFFKEMSITGSTDKKKILNEIKGKTFKETEEFFLEKKDENNIPRKVQLTLKQETVDALNKLKALKAHTSPDMDSLIMRMIETVTKIWDPVTVKRNRTMGEGKSRYVQVGVKAQIWKKDNGRCANCGSSYALELDHIHPYSLGGKTVSENMQLLCRNCNQRKGLKMFSGKFT